MIDKLKWIIVISVIVAATVSGFKFGKPHFKHATFSSDVQEILRIHNKDEKALREILMNSIEGYDIPVNQDDIAITGKRGDFSVVLKWSETVDLYGLYAKTFEFSVEASQ